VGHGFSAYTTLFLRSESAASSQIEQLTASARSIGLAELGDTSRRNATAVVANVHTTVAALELADRLDAEAILAVHRRLMEVEDPNQAGRWRREQVWVGRAGAGPRGALFVPPHHRHVEAAMNDLVDFILRDDLPVLPQVAVAHAQLETIHPFTDGNGRTGRALVHALLRAKGLTRSVSVPVSAGLLTDTTTYFDALTAYRTGDAEAIVARFAEATFAALANGRQLMAELDDVRQGWADRLTARRDSSAWPLLELVVRRPVIDIDVITGELGISRRTGYAAVDHLVNADVVQQVRGELRYRTWAATEVLEALDAFAERAGRRAVS